LYAVSGAQFGSASGRRFENATTFSLDGDKSSDIKIGDSVVAD